MLVLKNGIRRMKQLASKNKLWAPPISHYTRQLLELSYVNLNRTIQDLLFGKLSCLLTSAFNPFICNGVYAYVTISTEKGSQNVISPFQITHL